MRSVMVTIPCFHCKRDVSRSEGELRSNNGRAFCSRSCRAKWMFSGKNHPRWKNSGNVIARCKFCSNDFEAERYKIEVLGQQYCSSVCASKARKALTPKAAITCKQCSKEFHVNANSHAAKRTFCSYKCRSAFHDRSGPKNHRWKGGISSTRDTIKATEEYRQWRLSVFRRDHFKCVVCLNGPTESNTIEAHHLKKFRDYPELILDLDNGCTLCHACHRQTYNCEEMLESFLRNRILRDFTSDTRVTLDIVKIKSELRSDTKRSAEMFDPARVLASA